MTEEKDIGFDPGKVNIPIDAEKYKRTRSPSGSKSLSNGDELAVLIEGISATDLFEVANKILPENDFRTKYSLLNPGMQRMNLGNRFRGFISKRDKQNKKEELKAKSENRPPSLKLSGIDAITKAIKPVREQLKAAEAKKKAIEEGDAIIKAKEAREAVTG